jgi:adenylate kinase
MIKMMKNYLLLITGTPSIGKTTISKELAMKIDAKYVNVGSLVEKYNYSIGYDSKRKTAIADLSKLRNKVKQIIKSTSKEFIIVDGHYAASIVPSEKVIKAFVLRRNPIELKKLLKKRYSQNNKIEENLEAEILDVSLIETLYYLNKSKVCELDITNRTTSDIIDQIISILKHEKQCEIGKIDWLGYLESKGLIKEYFKN